VEAYKWTESLFFAARSRQETLRADMRHWNAMWPLNLRLRALTNALQSPKLSHFESMDCGNR
jgi:hypothetical protein